MRDEMLFHYHSKLNKLQELKFETETENSKLASPFFEGWYYKCRSEQIGNIAVIFGVSSSVNTKQAFIQIVHHTAIQGYYSFALDLLSIQDDPFIVRIGESTFTKQEAMVCLPQVQLHLVFDEIIPLPSSAWHPSIMGPLLYLKHLPCYHHIISLHGKASGYLLDSRTKKKQVFQGLGYIEKDYGVSFPSGYGWCHGVHEDAMIVAAVAKVPYVKKEHIGFFVVLKKGDQLLRFSSYQLGVVRRFSHYRNRIYMEFEQFLTQVSIHIEYQNVCQLKAPKNGDMTDLVEESLDCVIDVLVERREVVLFKETFTCATSEIFNYEQMSKRS